MRRVLDGVLKHLSPAADNRSSWVVDRSCSRCSYSRWSRAWPRRTPLRRSSSSAIPGLTAAERADIRADAEVRLVETLSLPRTELVAAKPGDVQDALRDLNADPDVVYAELNHRRQAFTPPNDPGFDVQWGLHNTAQILYDNEWASKGIYDADSDVLEAWDQGTSGDGQTRRCRRHRDRSLITRTSTARASSSRQLRQ